MVPRTQVFNAIGPFAFVPVKDPPAPETHSAADFKQCVQHSRREPPGEPGTGASVGLNFLDLLRVGFTPGAVPFKFLL